MLSGPWDSKLAVIAANLSDESEPFDSLAGRSFKDIMLNCGIGVHKVAFGWASEETKAELACRCTPFIILAGLDALQLYRPDLHVKECHGRAMLIPPGGGNMDGAIAMPVFHPEAYYRNPRWRSRVFGELVTLMTIAREPRKWLDHTPQTCVRCRGPFFKVDDDGVVFCEDHWGKLHTNRPLRPSEVARFFDEP